MVNAEAAIFEAKTRLAKDCLGETADKKLGPWCEMFTLSRLQKQRIEFWDWRTFLDKPISETDAWDGLGGDAFRAFLNLQVRIRRFRNQYGFSRFRGASNHNKSLMHECGPGRTHVDQYGKFGDFAD